MEKIIPDKKIIASWRLSFFIGLTIAMLIIAAILALFIFIEILVSAVRPIAIISIVFAAICSIAIFPFTVWVHRHYYFIIEKDTVKIYRGYFFMREFTVYTRYINHINIIRGPISRIFGLARITIHTSGGHFYLSGISLEKSTEMKKFFVRQSLVGNNNEV